MPTKPILNWVLLRGLTRESGHWGDFKAQLMQAFPHSQVTTLDLPGAGILYNENSPCSIPDITRKVREQAVQNGLLEAPVNLLAVSLGGMVALEWMQTHPDEINSGILINASFAGLNRFYERLRWQCYPKILRIIFQPDVYERELAVIKLISNRTNRHNALASEWHRIQTEHPFSLKNALSQLIAAARYCPDIKKPKMPFLLLNSLGDRLVAPHCTQALSQHWDVPFKTHPWAGHDLTVDDGAWVIEQLLSWYPSVNG